MRELRDSTSGTGDLGAHTISLAQFLLGDTVEVCGTRETVIKEREGWSDLYRACRELS